MLLSDEEIAILDSAKGRGALLNNWQEKRIVEINARRNHWKWKNKELFEWQRNLLREVKERLIKAGIKIEANRGSGNS